MVGCDLLQSLKNALEKNHESLQEGDILVITSKVISFAENRVISVKNMQDFQKKVRDEADMTFDEGEMVITLKNKILIPNAGIDNSNAPEGKIVLWPEYPFKSAETIYQTLKQEYKLKDLGIVLSDSYCHPLRIGTVGIAIAWAGFEGIQDECIRKDLFNKKVIYTKIAIADNFASTANLLMGETDASIPFVIIRGADVQFSDKQFSEKDYYINSEECIYNSIYDSRLTL